MNCINDFNCLIDFIKENPNDFDVKLKKQFAISTKICPYNKDWYMFKYDQFESDFCNPIVRAARGSVLEIKNDVRPICLPFYKFNNLGQEGCDEVDWNTAEVSLKIDGNLIKISKIDDEIFLFTNGSWADQGVEPTGLAGEETETDNFHSAALFLRPPQPSDFPLRRKGSGSSWSPWCRHWRRRSRQSPVPAKAAPRLRTPPSSRSSPMSSGSAPSRPCRPGSPTDDCVSYSRAPP